MKLLISAYACEPGKGSEPEVGFRTVLAAASKHDVWVLTRENNLPVLKGFLENHPNQNRVRLVGLDLHGLAQTFKAAGGTPGLYWYYDRWQREAARVAQRLDAEIGFDLVHHVTFASYWTRAGVAEVDKPFVLGPIGGGVNVPWGLVSELGPRGIVVEGARIGMRALMSRVPGIRRGARSATMILAQNLETARLFELDSVRVLPHSMAVGMLDRPAIPRTSEIAFAGRLLPWKGCRLAVRVMRYVEHPDAILCVYGQGPELRRMIKAAKGWGVRSRVRFEGVVPRELLLERIARSAALLHPAFHEEGGIAVAEAVSMRTPVVGLEWGGPRALLNNWGTSPSVLVPPSRPESTARRLAAALDGFLNLAEDPPQSPAPAPTYRDLLLSIYREATQHGLPRRF